MRKIAEEKKKHLETLSDDHGIISALAIDQRGSMRKMIRAFDQDKADFEHISRYKVLVSRALTPYASSILLDPEYGLAAGAARDKEAGLLLSYEQTGYEKGDTARMPRLLEEWSARRLKEQGADGIKILLYYNPDDEEKINSCKQAFVERVGDECTNLGLPFFLELITYDGNIEDSHSADYAELKPSKVIRSMEEFSKPRYQVDVLKVEVPVNMAFVEGYGERIVYSKEEAADYFRRQSEATELPFIFLSAGVSAELFQQTLYFAKKAGSTFNGVLCGRATWKDSVEIFVKEEEEATQHWLDTQGKENIESLNHVLALTATDWREKLK